MRRKCTESLIQWKKSSNRKPLILQGLRQIGKTKLLLDFGSKHYEDTLYINFETDKPAADYLSVPRDPHAALLFMETYADKPLRPSSSLLILDNIQCVPQIFTLLAAIALDFPQYHVAAIHNGHFSASASEQHDFDILTLYPMDFEEFLWAIAEFSLAREIRAHFTELTPMGKELHEKALTFFRLYLIVGGMPRAVLEYKKERSLLMIPDIEQKILSLFLSDITNSAPKGNSRACRNCWVSIPTQLGKSTRKFQYTRISKGATAKMYLEPLKWLVQSGLTCACPKVNAPDAKPYSHVHLYPIDTGLCTCMLKAPAYQFLAGEENAALIACTETFLTQHFLRNGHNIFYWSSGNQAEVPFLLEKSGEYIAVDYRLSPHQKRRNLMRFKGMADSTDMTNAEEIANTEERISESAQKPPYLENLKDMYLLSTEDFREKENYHIVPLYAAFCI